MDVDVAHHGPSDTTVVRVRGQLDIDSAARLGTALDDLHHDEVSRIVVDLSDVTFCDSTGLSALVVGYHRANRAGGYLRLAGPNAFLLRVLAVVGVLGTVPVFRSVASACRGDPAEAITGAPVLEED